jgi:xanthine dehydrogenase accessory factor
LIHRVQQGEQVRSAGLITYGVSKEEAARFGLPCGGTLRLVQEPLALTNWVDDLLERTARHELVRRTLDLVTGEVQLTAGARTDTVEFDGDRLSVTFGPRWRMLLVGAGQLSRVLAQMAQACGFAVLVCDPREEYFSTLQIDGVQWLPGMPDDVTVQIAPDAHTAIIALTHDPKLDDMALLEALKSPAFYVGALGSRRNTAARKQRLALFDLAETEIARLHGPVGLDIGSRTPSEIAVSILAEVLSVKNGVAPVQKKPVDAVEPGEICMPARV